MFFFNEKKKTNSSVINISEIFRKSKKAKRTNSDLQNITQKTKDRAARTPLKTGCTTDGLAVPDPHVTPVTVKQHEHNLIWKSCCTPVCINK